jgi:CBS domain-containing protein
MRRSPHLPEQPRIAAQPRKQEEAMNPIQAGRADSPIRDILTEAVATVHPDATLREVAETLAGHDIGVVLVSPVRDAVGMISERDLVSALATGEDIDTRRAAEAMSTELVSTTVDATVTDVAQLINEAGVRHVLVRDGDNLAGLVSIRDVLTALTPTRDRG